jgi:hypothetical protein
MYSAETGWMMLSTTAEYTTGASAAGGGASCGCAIVSPEPRVNAREAASLREKRTVMQPEVLQPVYPVVSGAALPLCQDVVMSGRKPAASANRVDGAGTRVSGVQDWVKRAARGRGPLRNSFQRSC